VLLALGVLASGLTNLDGVEVVLEVVEADLGIARQAEGSGDLFTVVDNAVA
jgi:hypothetical protein